MEIVAYVLTALDPLWDILSDTVQLCDLSSDQRLTEKNPFSVTQINSVGFLLDCGFRKTTNGLEAVTKLHVTEVGVLLQKVGHQCSSVNCVFHYGDVIMGAPWRLKSPASRWFTQPFIQAQIKENIKAPRHWPLCGEFTDHRWIPRTKDQ